jgi:hypothetical protein
MLPRERYGPPPQGIRASGLFNRLWVMAGFICSLVIIRFPCLYCFGGRRRRRGGDASTSIRAALTPLADRPQRLGGGLEKPIQHPIQ